MKNKLDKNSKTSSGKPKDSSTAPKSKSKDASPASAGKGKAEKESKSASDRSESRAKSDKAAGATKSTGPAKSAGAAKSPAKANRSNPTPVSKRPAAGRANGAKAAARARAEDEEANLEISLEEFAISLIKPGETKERIWRTKSFQQLPAQRDFGFPEVAPELPGQYNEPKLVLMPKDPEYMFCYWELTPSLIAEKEGEKLSSGSYRETLKINWESRSLFEPNFTFIPVFFWARKWYFGVPQVGQRYQVELGWLSDSGHFISIIRSNLSELPESWAATQKRLADEGEVLAYTSRQTKTLGSSEHLAVEDSRAFAPEWNLSSESMSSSSWSRGISSDTRTDTRETPAPTVEGSETRATSKGRKIRPAAPKARLEVSGKVLPGTQVFVGGNAVSTDAHGYFKIEFPYDKDSLTLELTSLSGASRSFTYDLKELVLT